MERCDHLVTLAEGPSAGMATIMPKDDLLDGGPAGAAANGGLAGHERHGDQAGRSGDGGHGGHDGRGGHGGHGAHGGANDHGGHVDGCRGAEPGGSERIQSARLYLVAWCLLAILALGYLAYVELGGATAGQKEEALARGLEANRQAVVRVARETKAARLDLAKFEKNLSTLEKNVANVRIEVAELRQSQTTILARLARLEGSGGAGATGSVKAGRRAKAGFPQNAGFSQTESKAQAAGPARNRVVELSARAAKVSARAAPKAPGKRQPGLNASQGNVEGLNAQAQGAIVPFTTAVVRQASVEKAAAKAVVGGRGMVEDQGTAAGPQIVGVTIGGVTIGKDGFSGVNSGTGGDGTADAEALGGVIVPPVDGLPIDLGVAPNGASVPVSSQPAKTRTPAHATPAGKKTALAAPRPTAAPAAPTAGAAPAARVPLPGRRKLGLELARGPNIASVRLSWDLIRERHGALLAGLVPFFSSAHNTGADGPRYRLIAGPLLAPEKAQRICQALTSQRVPCKVTRFVGAPL